MAKKKLSFVGNLFDDVPMWNMPVFGLENRRYLGCKSKLAEWILSIINNEAQGAYSFFDIFAGTGAIGRKALEYYQEVIFNDFLCSNVVSFKAFFADGELNEERVQDFIREMNNVMRHHSTTIIAHIIMATSILVWRQPKRLDI